MPGFQKSKDGQPWAAQPDRQVSEAGTCWTAQPGCPCSGSDLGRSRCHHELCGEDDVLLVGPPGQQCKGCGTGEEASAAGCGVAAAGVALEAVKCFLVWKVTTYRQGRGSATRQDGVFLMLWHYCVQLDVRRHLHQFQRRGNSYHNLMKCHCQQPEPCVKHKKNQINYCKLHKPGVTVPNFQPIAMYGLFIYSCGCTDQVSQQLQH